ncbi:MAG: hypothetical protein JNL35_13915 [Sphingopyxis sp.]|nr:hypothetical protein [Sphingopyxis sp.]
MIAVAAIAALIASSSQGADTNSRIYDCRAKDGEAAFAFQHQPDGGDAELRILEAKDYAIPVGSTFPVKARLREPSVNPQYASFMWDTGEVVVNGRSYSLVTRWGYLVERRDGSSFISLANPTVSGFWSIKEGATRLDQPHFVCSMRSGNAGDAS